MFGITLHDLETPNSVPMHFNLIPGTHFPEVGIFSTHRKYFKNCVLPEVLGSWFWKTVQ